MLVPFRAAPASLHDARLELVEARDLQQPTSGEALLVDRYDLEDAQLASVARSDRPARGLRWRDGIDSLHEPYGQDP
jgi:hypothetical protein